MDGRKGGRAEGLNNEYYVRPLFFAEAGAVK